MKELMGKEIAICAEGQMLRGKMIADFPDRIVLGSEKDGITMVSNIMKSKISSFTLKEDKTLKELEETGMLVSQIPLTVLACNNKQMSCPGVRFISNKTEKDLKKTDFELFMNQCPKKNKSCVCGVMGNISQIDSKTMVNMFSGLVIGDYPEAK